MPFTVLARDCTPPSVSNNRGFLSPDGHWGLSLSACQAVSMGGPWRGEATLTDRLSGVERTLDPFRFTGRDYWPWVGSGRAVWMDKKNRLILTSLSSQAAITVPIVTKRRHVRFCLLGSPDGALVLFAGSEHATVLAEDGVVLFEANAKGQLPAGFSSDGRAVALSVQDRPYGNIDINLYDATTGRLLERIDAKTIDPLIELGLSSVVDAKQSYDRSTKTGHGSWWHGRMMVRHDPESRTTFFGFSIPTGEMEEVFGKRHAVTVNRWVQVAMTA